MEREITLHSRLTHPNIISLYAAFQDAEGIYLVMVPPAPQQHVKSCANTMLFQNLIQSYRKYDGQGLQSTCKSNSSDLQESAAGDVHKLLGTQGGYLREDAAWQQVVQPLVLALDHLHAQASQRCLSQRSPYPEQS